MKIKALFAVYCLIVVAFLVRAELKTLPLLEPDLSFVKLQHPIQGATIEYAVSELSTRSPLSTYRGGSQRQGWEQSSAPLFKNFQLKWKVENLNTGIHRASKSSPAADESGFYIADDTGFLRAYDWEGRLRWQFYDEVSAKGFHSTPLTDQDTVYVGDYAGYIYAFNKENGEIRWITKAGITVGSSPFMHEGVLYVGIELGDPDGFLLALDARTGAWLWTSPFIGNHPHASPALSSDGKSLLMGSNTGEMKAFARTNGEPLWSFATKDDIKCAASIYDDQAFFVSWDGYLYALDANSGVQKWKVALDDGAMSCPSLSADGQKIAVTGYRRNFVVDRKTGSTLWSAPIANKESRAQASPLILQYANQQVVLFLCAETALCVQDLNSGQVLQKIEMGSSFSASPIYYKNHLLLSTVDNGLLVFTQ
ncbi:PQQ-binding-like beta-propeller repeat protein [Bdellovibrio bacteriovorus]|uniref:outer membrane protein assembly factor BamB family protein n=1 Tax=Bdellovibrio bacteriovorus TaxID=959 RepID=UPI0035A72EEC